MTKQELIEEMRSLLPDNKWAHSDFEIDRGAIEKMDDSDLNFIWLIRSQGTELRRLDKEYLKALLSSESTRFMLMRDEDWQVKSILSYDYDKNGQWFLCDGNDLFKINRVQALIAYNKAYKSDIENLKYQYPQEYLVRDTPLELVFSDGAKEKLTATMGKAAELNDCSLLDCFYRLQHWSRIAIDHKIEIHTDFAPYSFGFCERVNGQPRICGGIIYHEGERDKHWSIHT